MQCMALFRTGAVAVEPPLFQPSVPLGSFLAAGANLLDDIKVRVGQLSGVDQKLALSSQDGLSAFWPQHYGPSRFSFRLDVDFKGAAGLKAEPLSNGLRDDDTTVIVDLNLHNGADC